MTHPVSIVVEDKRLRPKIGMNWHPGVHVCVCDLTRVVVLELEFLTDAALYCFRLIIPSNRQFESISGFPCVPMAQCCRL